MNNRDCPYCEGSSWEQQFVTPCRECKGTGKLADVPAQKEQETTLTPKPDFPDWIKSHGGQDCLQWPIPDIKYLENRLFWAFDAGRDFVWQQYLKQKLKAREKERMMVAWDQSAREYKKFVNDLHWDDFHEWYSRLNK